jgi:acyl-CoA thioester hydrolase
MSKHHLFTTRIPVRWIDQDLFGHVNNAMYFTYFEQARVDWLATLDVEWEQGVGPVIVRTTCEYKRPVSYPATVVVDFFADEPGRSSVQTHYEIRVDGDPDTLYAFGEARVVWVDVAKGRPVSLPDKVREAIGHNRL